jgi:hypothetical protein
LKKKKTIKREQAAASTEPEAKKPKPSFTTISDEQFLEALKQLGKPASSREISDALGIKDPDKGRGIVRVRMAKLIKEGKVKAVEPAEKMKVAKLYSVA